jgi:ATP-dependent DNA helicase RecQ
VPRFEGLGNSAPRGEAVFGRFFLGIFYKNFNISFLYKKISLRANFFLKKKTVGGNSRPFSGIKCRGQKHVRPKEGRRIRKQRTGKSPAYPYFVAFLRDSQAVYFPPKRNPQPFFQKTIEMTPQEALLRYFGYKQFRPLQEEIIGSVLEGRDTLALMPTGGGKSLCYQIPALVKPGVGLVVSPLIALMKDQVEGLRQNEIAAAFINSAQSHSEQDAVMEAALRGEIKLLYVSPEKMQSERFRMFIERLDINLLAVDEAHCVSFWGHDFRPEYTQLHWLKERFPAVPVIALTATADRLTRQDIAAQLRLRDPNIFLRSFDRPNLRLEVRPGVDRVNEILRFLQNRSKDAGIVYCLSRKSVESLADKLCAKGIRAAAYHAGLDPKLRARVQEDFLRDNLQVICATIAFGMGIDKPNVRFVIHYNLPKNIESYYQEIGRAGRDGLPADTVLFYAFNDLMLQREMIQEEDSSQREIKLAKLERLQQYVEGHVCRRRILLQYFNEQVEKNCGHCDVCEHPRQTFDGTIIAQKALSAIARTNQKAPMGSLIDVLRGMRNATVMQHKFDQLKTFGAGRDLSNIEWQSYFAQLLNLGLVEIAYEDNYALRLTEKSRPVLFENQPVHLVRVAPLFKSDEKASRERNKPKTKAEALYELLFDRLRNLRKTIADGQGIPPHQVFNDETLSEMAKQRPINSDQLTAINGMTARKLAMYGADFMGEIVAFLAEDGSGLREATYFVTWRLFQQGHRIEAIARQRELSAETIYGHFARLNELGYRVDLDQLIPAVEQAEIRGALERIPHAGNEFKPVHEALRGRYGYGKIKLVATFALSG